jgi:hypothetical protein
LRGRAEVSPTNWVLVFLVVTGGRVRGVSHIFPVSIQNHRSLKSTSMKSISRFLTGVSHMEVLAIIYFSVTG